MLKSTWRRFKECIYKNYELMETVWNHNIVRVFANGPGDLGSIPGRVIPKTQKMVLDASLLNTQHYKVRIKGKVEQSREGVAPSPTHCCSSYRKGSLRVTLDYGRQLYSYRNISISHTHTKSTDRLLAIVNLFHLTTR